MQTLAEIMASPEALDTAAAEFVEFHATKDNAAKDMNTGIKSSDELIELLNGCGNSSKEEYKKFWEIGLHD